MKCICGYEYDVMESRTPENEPFKRISGSTFKVSSSDGYGREEEVYLFACPKCDTVKMSKWL